MDADDIIPSLAEAEALFRSGDFGGAKTVIEDMPSIDRCEPSVVDLELRLIPALGDWSRVRQLCDWMEFAVGDEYKITVAEVRVEWAAKLLAEGEKDSAYEQIRQAFELWIPIKLQVLDDERFNELF